MLYLAPDAVVCLMGHLLGRNPPTAKYFVLCFGTLSTTRDAAPHPVLGRLDTNRDETVWGMHSCFLSLGAASLLVEGFVNREVSVGEADRTSFSDHIFRSAPLSFSK